MDKSEEFFDPDTLPETIPGTTSYKGQGLDAILHACYSRFNNWLSPAAFYLACFDWLVHLSIAPAKQADLLRNALRKNEQFIDYLQNCISNEHAGAGCKPSASDMRFKDPSWQIWPFNVYAQGFLLREQWLHAATTSVRGVSKHHSQVVNFMTRQMLDVFSPSNFAWTNPEVIKVSWQQSGANFIRGLANFAEDWYRNYHQLPPAGSEKFQVGVNLAVTPGKVIYRNDLIELIQYQPKTPKVYAEPVFIVPAWIMKYYILDLSAENSLVNYLVENGHTVFMISWKNPTREDWNLALDDYLHLGIFAALDVINQIIPQQKIHAVGYCLGGTLLTMAAASLANKNDERIKTVTLFAAQVDFREAGELQLFVDTSQLSFLEDVMWVNGFLDGQQMAGAFNMLQSNVLIWSRMIHDYLLGERRPLNDLMFWNADTTRLPFRMHSEYLHHLFLNNDLTQGRCKVDRKKIALLDINVPIFAVSTTRDHVSPWRSIYKLHLFTDTELTFVLTNGGHNAGIVSPLTHPNRHYQIKTRKPGDRYITSETWQERAPQLEGSWWPAWQNWLVEHSSGQIAAPALGNADAGLPALCEAPGTYVFEK